MDQGFIGSTSDTRCRRRVDPGSKMDREVHRPKAHKKRISAEGLNSGKAFGGKVGAGFKKLKTT